MPAIARRGRPTGEARARHTSATGKARAAWILPERPIGAPEWRSEDLPERQAAKMADRTWYRLDCL